MSIPKNQPEYNLPGIADKLEKGESLDEIEGQMAAGTIRDWLRQTEARIKGGKLGGAKSRGGGRPRKYKTASERQKAYLERKKAG